MEEKIKNIKIDFEKEISLVKTQAELENLRIKYLGRKSIINEFFSQLASLSKEEKINFGRALNLLKQEIELSLEKKIQDLKQREEDLDLTFPSQKLSFGTKHLLTQTIEKICEIFKEIGFLIIEGKEIEDEFHNFTALNISLEHPSRDAFDTFYLDLPEKENNRFLLRSHTSPSQIRVLKKFMPPIAVISPGRVYRPDQVDASHSFMFHQIEGFVVNKNINFAHLKGTLFYFVKNFFSPETELRFRPHFFPFTEPSAEVDISCFVCKNKKELEKKCSVCKGKGWLEILGCGMIHPKVLKNCGINSEKFKGFAFGMGIERITMLKYGIEDIRLFFENDLRFLEQFY